MKEWKVFIPTLVRNVVSYIIYFKSAHCNNPLQYSSSTISSHQVLLGIGFSYAHFQFLSVVKVLFNIKIKKSTAKKKLLLA